VADPAELIPLLVVALVMLSAGGADVTAIDVAVDGDRTVTAVEDVLVVGGGTVTVPADTRVEGSIYVIGGEATVAGQVDGDLVQLAGEMTVTDGAAVAGDLRLFGGERQVAAGASVGSRTAVPELVAVERSPLEQLLLGAGRAGLLALAGYLLARRNPTLLANVGDSIADHGLVSATVGLLASATGVALAVFMALTVVLLPVSLLTLLVGAAVVAYGYVAFGYLVGQRLPLARPAPATAAGVLVFVVATDLLARVPLVGSVVGLVVPLVGVGAVLITYFGLARFEPPAIPD